MSVLLKRAIEFPRPLRIVRLAKKIDEFWHISCVGYAVFDYSGRK
jgi:hypothetical protein